MIAPPGCADAVRAHAAAARAAIRSTTASNQAPKQEDQPETEQRHAA